MRRRLPHLLRPMSSSTHTFPLSHLRQVVGTALRTPGRRKRRRDTRRRPLVPLLLLLLLVVVTPVHLGPQWLAPPSHPAMDLFTLNQQPQKQPPISAIPYNKGASHGSNHRPLLVCHPHHFLVIHTHNAGSLRWQWKSSRWLSMLRSGAIVMMVLQVREWVIEWPPIIDLVHLICMLMGHSCAPLSPSRSQRR